MEIAGKVVDVEHELTFGQGESSDVEEVPVATELPRGCSACTSESALSRGIGF